VPDQIFGFLRQRCTLEKHAADLLFKSACAPSFNTAHLRIEVTLQRVIEVNNLSKMGPAQLCPQCGHNLDVGEHFRKADHSEQVPRPEATAKLGPQ